MGADALPRALSLAVHELRTPVGVISGYLRLLLREQGGSLTETQVQMLDAAARSCRRLGHVIAEMSELGRLESHEVAFDHDTVDVAAIVNDLASQPLDGHDRGLILARRGADRPLLIRGDRERLTLALGSLIHATAREHDHGVVMITCSTVVEAGCAWAVVAIGPEPLITELVEGAGKANTEFDEWRGGVGLALPVARRVIEALGGRMWSARGDRPRMGSAIRLPLAEPPSR